MLLDSFVVSARVKKSGGISYEHSGHRVLESGTNEDGIDHEVTQWRTTRDIPDRDELRAAQTLRGRLLRDLNKLGVKTDSGFVLRKSWTLEEDEQREGFCEHGIPRARACGRCEALAWFDRARSECWAFNSESRYNSLRVTMAFLVMEDSGTGEMVADDLRELLGKLIISLDEADPTKIRQVVRRMQGYEDLVVPEVSGPLSDALTEVKLQANGISQILTDTAGDLDLARQVIDFAPVELARFALDEASPPDELPELDEEVPSVASGTVFETGEVEFNEDEEVDL